MIRASAMIKPHFYRFFYRRPVALGNLGPIVTFTFDDFPRSAMTVGASIVERAGGRATYYVTMGLMGKKNQLGEHFDCDDLRSLVDRGHEVASHTYSHLSAKKSAIDAFKQDVDRGERAICESIAITSSHNFAYPYGDVTLNAKKEVGQRMRAAAELVVA